MKGKSSVILSQKEGRMKWNKGKRKKKRNIIAKNKKLARKEQRKKVEKEEY